MIDPQSIDLDRHFATWFGPPTKARSPLAAEYSWLPQPLQEWMNLCSERSPNLSGINYMVEPNELVPADGLVEFMTNGSGDWHWAFDTADMSTVLDRSAGRNQQWVEVPEKLPEFIVHLAHFEAIYSNHNRTILCDEVPHARLPDVIGDMAEVAFGGWRWPMPGHRIFVGTKTIASIGPATSPIAPFPPLSDLASVRVSSFDLNNLEYLSRIPGTNWF